MKSQLEALRAFEVNRALAARSDRHDLRTPLNAILLSLEGIRLLGDLNNDQMTSLALAEKNYEAVCSMLDQMLDIDCIDARGGAALTKRAALPLELIARATEQIAALATERRQILKSSTATIRALAVDSEKIVRVLVNLLANAVKFTPGGGVISVAAADSEEDGSRAVLFTVSDSGIGLREADIARIFSEGFRVKADAPTHRSTGIGLTFCKRVVEAHGGKIWVESQPGHGATFRFRLPAPI